MLAKPSHPNPPERKKEKRYLGSGGWGPQKHLNTTTESHDVHHSEQKSRCGPPAAGHGLPS